MKRLCTPHHVLRLTARALHLQRMAMGIRTRVDATLARFVAADPVRGDSAGQVQEKSY